MSIDYTIKDDVVMDSVLGVGIYDMLSDEYKAAVDGGIANQIYVVTTVGENESSNLLRPSHDIDISVYPRLTTEEFRNNFVDILERVVHQYEPSIRVGRHVYEITVKGWKGPFFIHSYRFSKNGFEREKRNVERKVSNANIMELFDTPYAVRIVRPEDILQGKLRRLRKVEEYGFVPEEMKTDYTKIKRGKWDSLIEGFDLVSRMEDIAELKESLPAYYDAGIDVFHNAMRKYTFMKDVWDIALIFSLAERGMEFDEGYFARITEGLE